MLINKARAGLAVVAVTVAAGVFAVGSPASAAGCGSAGTNKDPSGAGEYTGLLHR
ncbi:hypothetical protein F4553_001901 [Allocatelliglobosispora scoriae]|uniref:Uncharacterized protein n=1 Tax=Allocatelliglobosispora scoriae TaxID=643052 RepID=A0A841BP55_9ACTN|nr:hypothetical protein [Allocatelliglobosispora scoriae]MBB5868522.1 hypothetical protein [Allocatelliglobosispora scoriae]